MMPRVAMVTDRDGIERLAIQDVTSARKEPCWWFRGSRAWIGIGQVSARPLAVIDPEDRKAVERLRDETLRMLRDHIGIRAVEDSAFTEGDLANAMQAALREYADPKPPKPEEPQGLGAVVEDREGLLWVRVSQTSITKHWRCSRDVGSGRRAYDDLDVAKILSDGVIQ